MQFLACRTLPAVLRGAEVALFLVVLAYFCGCSAGYWLSDRLSDGGLKTLAWAQWVTHLSLPFSLRWAAGWMEYLEWGAFSLAVLLFLGAFWLSLFYSLLLPRLLGRDGDGAFARGYGMELAGAVSAAALLAGLRFFPERLLFGLYQANLAAVLYLTLRDKRALLAGLPAALIYAAAFPGLERWSVKGYYELARDMDVREVLFSADTPYQRAEILEDSDGVRHLYLDGIRHYGSDSLEDFNYFIAGLPASLLPGADVLIVGSGSFEAARQAAVRARAVENVELDPVVAREGARFLSRPAEAGASGRRSLSIDDAKHHIARVSSPKDLIVLDVAGPFQRQVALLYTREFLSLAASRLRPGGAVSVCLNSDFSRKGYTGCRIAATLLETFRDVFVVARPDGGSSFAVAGDGLRFSKRDILRSLAAAGKGDCLVYERAEVERALEGGGHRPITLSDMDIVLRGGFGKLKRRYF